MLNLLLKTCEKKYQPSRKTTLQMIDELIGDPMPKKLIFDIKFKELVCLG